MKYVLEREHEFRVTAQRASDEALSNLNSFLPQLQLKDSVFTLVMTV
jgi:hypothetical protein